MVVLLGVVVGDEVEVGVSVVASLDIVLDDPVVEVVVSLVLVVGGELVVTLNVVGELVVGLVVLLVVRGELVVVVPLGVVAEG